MWRRHGFPDLTRHGSHQGLWQQLSETEMKRYIAETSRHCCSHRCTHTHTHWLHQATAKTVLPQCLSGLGWGSARQRICHKGLCHRQPNNISCPQSSDKHSTQKHCLDPACIDLLPFFISDPFLLHPASSSPLTSTSAVTVAPAPGMRSWGFFPRSCLCLMKFRWGVASKKGNHGLPTNGRLH